MSMWTDFKALFNPAPPEGYRIERNKLGYWRWYVVGSTGTQEGCDFGEARLLRRNAVLDAWSHRNLQCYETARNAWEPETPKVNDVEQTVVLSAYKKPVVVCLCGSTKFKDAYIKAARDETLAGKIVLTVGLFGHDEGLDMSGETKVMLDELHKRRIDLADEVLILNVGGYIGKSTNGELDYACKKGKDIRFLELPGKKAEAGSTMENRFVYRSIPQDGCTIYEIGECDSPRKHEGIWCDRKVCEGFWGDEAQCKWTVDAMNKATGSEEVK